ncbi:hypothetical protein [Aquimarina gracilis]
MSSLKVPSALYFIGSHPCILASDSASCLFARAVAVKSSAIA